MAAKTIKKTTRTSLKKLSNPFSTGGGGEHFQAQVQASFVALMLTNGFAPCLPTWPIKSISLQAKHEGYDTDDLVVSVENPQSKENRKILVQIKHTIRVTSEDKTFGEVIDAAWSDFNKITFSRGKDSIVLITGPLSSSDINDVRTLLEWARHSDTPEEFIKKVDLTNFSNKNKRAKFQAFRKKLKEANDSKDVSDDDTFLFLRHFHLLGYDLDIKAGITIALLHSHMGFYVKEKVPQIWSEIVEEVTSDNKNAKTITLENISESLRSAFTTRPIVTLPEEFTKKEVLIEWRNNPNISELASASLIGGWHETSTGDIEILSRLTKVEYGVWIRKVQGLLQYNNGPIGLRNGTWILNHRNELLRILGPTITDRDLAEFNKLSIDVLTERDPKFDLASDQRFAANVFGKNTFYSRSLRHGIAEGLALLAHKGDALTNCSQHEVKKILVLTIRGILEEANWELWATLSRELPLLAEASPVEFLKAIERALDQPSQPLDQLYKQEGDSIFGESYVSGLCWALEVLAWDEDYLTRVTVILGELDVRDPGGQWSNRPKNSLIAIFMPFYPQTFASVSKRKAAIENLIKESPNVAWKLLLSLLPEAHQTSMGTHKPKWGDTRTTVSATQAEYAEQISNYASLTIRMASGNLERLNDLVQHLDDLPKMWFDKALKLFSTKSIRAKSGKLRYELWKSLAGLARKHRRYANAKWALPGEVVTRIEKVVEDISPEDLIEISLPLFDGHASEYYDASGNWEKQLKKLDDSRFEAVKNIFSSKGLPSIFHLFNLVESPAIVGGAFSKIENSAATKRILPKLLDTANAKEALFVNGFVWGKVANFGWEWAEKINKSKWSKLQVAKFLSYLPFDHQTWIRVSKWLGSNESEYWRLAIVNPYFEKLDMTLAIDKLIKYGRPRASVQCIARMLHDSQPLDPKRTGSALLAAISSNEPIAALDIYSVTELIKSLQADSNADVEMVERVEWAYLQLLDHDDPSPKFLQRKLATDPNFFCNLINKTYRPSNDSKSKPSKEVADRDQTFAINAWRLLREWRVPPGIVLGVFSKRDFTNWFKVVKRECTKSNRLAVAFNQFGQVLFYSPPDKNGLWIERSIAEILNGKDHNEIRTGYYMQAHNSRGAHMVDPTGQPELQYELEYRQKADKIESEGYHRFAITLREIAESFKRQAETIIRDH